MCKKFLSVFLVVYFMPTTSSRDVIVKIDSSLQINQDCAKTKLALSEFFKDASFFLHQATNQLSLFNNIVIQLPSELTNCGQDVAAMNFPPDSVDVWMKNDSHRVWQFEGCQKMGNGIVLPQQVLTQGPKEKKPFVSNWLKYNYGVFDESGGEDGSMYPAFYSVGSQVLPTSCTDQPINGNFTDECLINPGSSDCFIDESQDQIHSSILFASDSEYFNEINKVCNSSNHARTAPNQQNLICGSLSPMEIIAAKENNIRQTFQTPNVTFVQGKTNFLVIILDQSVNMNVLTQNKNRWYYARLGLAQMFLMLKNQTSFGLIKSLNTLQFNNYTLPQLDSQLSTIIFGEHVEFHTHSWSLKDALNIAFQKTEGIVSPSILIVTATPTNEDLTDAIGIIKSRKLKVDVVTFSGVENPSSLLKLTTFGDVYAISEMIDDTKKIHQVGSMMRQSISPMYQDVHQDVVHLQFTLPYHGEFQVPAYVENPSINILILSPYDNIPSINIKSPSGKEYSKDNLGIDTKWSSSKVLYVKSPTFEPGNWSINLTTSRPMSENTSLVVTTSVGESHFGRGFIDSTLKYVQVNASELQGLTIFGQLTLDANDSSVEVEVCHTQLNCHNLVLKDNGLTVPDITKDDGIFSNYYTQLSQSGFYSTYFKATLGQDQIIFWPGPSFYVAVPVEDNGQDNIAPSRITDLTIRKFPGISQMINLEWTAPGDDLNEGDASYYKILCGFSPETVSYDNCDIIRETVTFAHPAGHRESINRTIKSFSNDQTFYFGIVALDGATNESPLSNVASVYVRGPTTTPPSTTPTSTTTPASSEIAPSQNSTTEGGIQLSTGEFLSIVAGLSGVLLLLLSLLVLYFCIKNRKKKMDESHLRMPPSRVLNMRKTTQRTPMSPPFDIDSGYNFGSGSIYIDSVGNPIERGPSRNVRRSDYEYRVSRIETPPNELVVRQTPRGQKRLQNFQVSESDSSLDDESSEEEIQIVRHKRREMNDRSSKVAYHRGGTNYGYEGSPSPEVIRKPRTPKSNRHTSRDPAFDELNAKDLIQRHVRQQQLQNQQLNRGRKSGGSQHSEGFEIAGNGVFGGTPKHNSAKSREPIQVTKKQQVFSGSPKRNPSFFQMQELHNREDSMESASTSATFHRVDFDPNTGVQTSDLNRILEVDSDEEPNYRNPPVSNNAPFNYIAFSQQLYGDSNETPRTRAISFV